MKIKRSSRNCSKYSIVQNHLKWLIIDQHYCKFCKMDFNCPKGINMVQYGSKLINIIQNVLKILYSHLKLLKKVGTLLRLVIWVKNTLT